MQEKGGPDVTKRQSCGKSGLANFDGVELALDVAAPEFQKPAQFGEIRGEIGLLPDEALQPVGMIREMVDDLRGRQPIIAKLLLVVAHRHAHVVCLSDRTSMRDRLLPYNQKTRHNNRLAAHFRV